MVQIHVPPPLTQKADLAQPAEHIHGKDGVFGSNPKIGSSTQQQEDNSLLNEAGFFVSKNKSPSARKMTKGGNDFFSH